MKNTLLKYYVKMQVLKDALVRDESGQDLVEYALVVSLIALGATASMTALATSFSTAFSKVGSKLATYTS
jgi:Flp pilus assembly pilin Flp